MFDRNGIYFVAQQDELKIHRFLNVYVEKTAVSLCSRSLSSRLELNISHTSC